MAVQTPLHLQRSVVIHQRHAVHGAVTGIATYTLVDVNAVIEISEVGKIVHPRPDQRLAALVALPDRLKQRRVGPDLGVAVHTGLGGRNTGEAGGLDRGMTVAAIDSQAGYVMLVAERNRLRFAHPGIGDVGRSLNFRRRPKQCRHHKHGTVYGRP